VVGRLAGENTADSPLAGVLAQGGEFAFVVFSLATQNKLLDQHLRDVLVVAITLSMALTPVLVVLFERLVPKDAASKPVYDHIDEDASASLPASALRHRRVLRQRPPRSKVRSNRSRTRHPAADLRRSLAQRPAALHACRQSRVVHRRHGRPG
jgi:glutathione-regulated potassium-efflux system protein KefB